MSISASSGSVAASVTDLVSTVAPFAPGAGVAVRAGRVVSAGASGAWGRGVDGERVAHPRAGQRADLNAVGRPDPGR